jgi:hypothetical protein
MAIHLHRARVMQDSSIGKLIFHDQKQKLPKDYHKENMQLMRKKEHDLQHKLEE